MYVAIMTDTGSFRYSNTTSTSLQIAAELVGRGVSPDETYRQIYGAIPRRFGRRQTVGARSIITAMIVIFSAF